MQKSIHGGDIYRNKVKMDFSANINPLGTPKSVIKAMDESIKNCATYPDPYCSELSEEIARHEGVKKEEILCGNGAADLIFSLVIATKPKKALIQAPTFAEYEQALKAMNCHVEYFETQDDFSITEKILQEIKEDLDILFLCSPNNPTGLLIKHELLLKIAEKCKEKNVILALDECFGDFVQEETSLKNQVDKNKNIIIFKAFTKMYAVPGVRLGYAISGNEKLLKKMKESTQPWSVSSVAQACGLACLKEDEFVETTKKYIKEQREFLTRELESLGFKTYKSKVNYILFKSDMELYDSCLAQGILIRDCSNYRCLTKDFYRIAVRTEKENKKLIETLKKIKGNFR